MFAEIDPFAAGCCARAIAHRGPSTCRVRTMRPRARKRSSARQPFATSLQVFFLPSLPRSRSYASRLLLPRPGTGSSHGSVRRTMEGGRCGSPTACFCSPIGGRREVMVPPLLGCTGILNAMQSFMQVFPEGAIPPRIFPAHPRSLASVLIPRPAARRDSAFSAFRKSLRQKRNDRRKKRFSEPSENASLGLGSGAHSRRFAQECPEGNPGKYKQGETQWHSTKTRSL